MSDPEPFLPECGHPCRYLIENRLDLSPEHQWRFRTWCCRCENREPCSLCAPLDTPEDRALREESFEIGRQAMERIVRDNPEVFGTLDRSEQAPEPQAEDEGRQSPASNAPAAGRGLHRGEDRLKTRVALAWENYKDDLEVIGAFFAIPLGAAALLLLSGKLPIRELVRGKPLSDAVTDVLQYRAAVSTSLGTFQVSLTDVMLYSIGSVVVLGVLAVFLAGLYEKWMDWRGERSHAKWLQDYDQSRPNTLGDDEGEDGLDQSSGDKLRADPGRDPGEIAKPSLPDTGTRPMWTIARGIRRLLIVMSLVVVVLGWVANALSVALVLVGILWVGYVAGCWIAAGFWSKG